MTMDMTNDVPEPTVPEGAPLPPRDRYSTWTQRLAHLSGGSADLDSDPGDVRRSVQYGISLAITWVFGTVTGTGFAISFLHLPFVFALLVGLLWGTSIFTLERGMLFVIENGKSRATRTAVIVRVSLAIMASLVTTEFLVDACLHGQVLAIQSAQKTAAIAQVEKTLQPSFDAAQARLQEAEAMIHGTYISRIVRSTPAYTAYLNAETQVANWQKIVSAERLGTGGSLKPGFGPNTKYDLGQLDKAKSTLAKAITQLQVIEKQQNVDGKAARGSALSTLKNLTAVKAAQIAAVKLPGGFAENSSTVGAILVSHPFAGFLVFCLAGTFVLIDLGALLTKVAMPKSRRSLDNDAQEQQDAQTRDTEISIHQAREQGRLARFRAEEGALTAAWVDRQQKSLDASRDQEVTPSPLAIAS